MLPVERRAASSLAGIFSLRMLGLFMLLPVLSLYAESFEQATPMLMGIALGIYGLTQALFQIPFGMLSDRWGRKRVIALGLVIFALGSVVAALATTIEWIIIGRAIQGAGAIAAAAMALLADLTREEFRTRAMAVFGMSIGFSFMAAIILGPILNGWIGVSGIFWVTALLALLGLVVLFRVVPTPAHSHMHHDAETDPAQFREVLRDGQLLRLDFGIFALHLILTAIFVVIPVGLRDAGLLPDDHWMVYLGVMVIAVGIMVPMIIIAEKRGKMKEVFSFAIVLVALSQFGLWQLSDSMWGIIGMLVLFFGGFNLLEATLPSLIAKIAPVDKKGTAMGVYSSSQFLGAFLGGIVGGGVLSWSGGEEMGVVFLVTGIIAIFWLLLALSMKRPQTVKTRLVRTAEIDEVQAILLAKKYQAVAGVTEAVVIAEDRVAYLKIDEKSLDQEQLESIVQQSEA
ncbi:MAG: MFS transporter [Gammaproteobacteria bacterium]|nr:MFS transporter [Gammaproteobacteria bacterium]